MAKPSAQSAPSKSHAKASSRPAGVSPIKTVAELAKLVNRNHSQISRWTKREDWPFSRKPPWARSLVPEVLRWAANHLTSGRPVSQDSGDSEGKPKTKVQKLREQKLEQEVRKLRAQADQAETSLARERGALVDANEVEREWASLGALVRGGFQSLPSQLVPLALSHGMPHESAPVFQEQVTEAITAILRKLSGDEASDDGGDAENNQGSPTEIPGGTVPTGTVDAERVG